MGFNKSGIQNDSQLYSLPNKEKRERSLHNEAIINGSQDMCVPFKRDYLSLPKPPRDEGRAASEVQFCGQVAVDVEAEGFFQEGFGDAEIVGQIP